MSTFLAIIGFCVGLLLFLYLLSIKESVSSIIKPRLTKEKIKSHSIQFNYANIQRLCPICRTALSNNECLICAMEPEVQNLSIQTQQSPEKNKKRQVHIYGCKYCFTSGGINLHPQLENVSSQQS